MDAGVWVFIGYFLAIVCFLLLIAVIYVTIVYGPKIKKFIAVWMAILRLMQSTGDNIEKLGKDLEALLESLKELKK
jgi:hypothetical protein